MTAWSEDLSILQSTVQGSSFDAQNAERACATSAASGHVQNYFPMVKGDEWKWYTPATKKELRPQPVLALLKGNGRSGLYTVRHLA